MPWTRRALVRGGLAALAGLLPSRTLAAGLVPDVDPAWEQANASYRHNLSAAPPRPPAATRAASGPG